MPTQTKRIVFSLPVELAAVLDELSDMVALPRSSVIGGLIDIAITDWTSQPEQLFSRIQEYHDLRVTLLAESLAGSPPQLTEEA